MAATTSSYSITMRLYTAPDHGIVGAVATAISSAGGIVTAIDVAESSHDRLVVDVTCSASDSDHAAELVSAVDGVDGVEVHKTSDRTFLLHIGGKIEVTSKVPLKNRDDLSMAYTPGVGRVSMALAKNPEDVPKLTIKGNSVAVVTDGSAVLGLGNIGPGRGAAGDGGQGRAVQAVRRHRRLADLPGQPGLRRDRAGGRDDRAGLRRDQPRGHRGAALLRDRDGGCGPSLDIPVFHDDQHGTAIVVLAALTNALRCVHKDMTTVRIVVSGGGAAGTAIVTLLLAAGVTDVVVVDRAGALCADDEALSESHRELAAATNPRRRAGRPAGGARRRRRVHRGQRARHPQAGVDRGDGRRRRWSSRWPTPTPRSTPTEAEKYAAVVASGRSDYPNQINNVLAFPGVFRGLLDARASRDHHRHAAPGGRGDRARGQGRGAEPELHHPDGLPPRRAQGRRRRDLRQGAHD